MPEWLGWVRLVAAALLFGLSLLATFRVPHGALWLPAVASIEWGHVFALVSGCLLLGGWGAWPKTASFILAAVATIGFCGPAVRAALTAEQVSADLARFGAETSGASFSFARLFTWSGSGPAPLERTFAGADGEELRMSVYGAQPGERRPLVVAIHGGSWNSGDDTQLPQVNRLLASRGFVVAAVTYRLSPASQFPAAVDDVAAAVDDLQAHAEELGIDPERVVLLGRSAGAQIALSLGYRGDDASIVGVVSLYAPSDQRWGWEHPTSPWILDTPTTLSEYLGGPLDEEGDAYDAASPIRFVDADTPPTLLVHGGRDELVFHEQSARLARRLEEQGVRHVFLSLPWATHGCDANLRGPSGQLYTHALLAFLERVT